MKKKFIDGLKDGIPIALGYLSVSFSIGIMALASGLNVYNNTNVEILVYTIILLFFLNFLTSTHFS